MKPLLGMLTFVLFFASAITGYVANLMATNPQYKDETWVMAVFFLLLFVSTIASGILTLITPTPSKKEN